jgi:hypothetical protein
MIARLFILPTLLCAAMLLAQQSNPISSVSAPVDPIAGSIDLPNGSHAQYTYFFDHNALADGVIVGEFLLAITDSGNLLRLNADSLEMTGQTIVPGSARSIAAESKDSALIGTLDGHVYRARAQSLQLEAVASTSGSIVWLSTGLSSSNPGGRIVFVVDRSPDVRPWPGERDKAFQTRARAAALRVANAYAVEVFENGRLRELPFPKLRLFTIPGHYLLDSHDRLWMGADNGEWGGMCYFMDLRNGAVQTLKENINGVLGFFFARQGRTIVYGGFEHMGMYEGYIAEVKTDGISNIANFEHNGWERPSSDGHIPEAVQKAVREAAERSARENKDKPNGPIDLIKADSTGGYWVVSEQVLFHADEEFKVWRRITDLGGRWIGGRRFSVGSTPTINELIEGPTGSNGLIAVMGKDGVERISNDKIERHSFAGQLESSVLDIWKTTRGLMLVDTDFENRPLWKQEGNQWRRYSLFPDHPPANDGTQWDFAEPFGNEGSRIAAFAHDNIGGGTAFMIELDENDAAEVVDSWPGDSSQYDTAFLVTSGGDVLKTTDQRLFRRSGKKWETIGVSDFASSLVRRGTINGREFVLLGTANGSDIFLETYYGDLLQLRKTGRGSLGYSLSRSRFNGQAAPRAVFDAVPEPANRVLLTTAHGILELNLETGKRTPISSPRGGEVITSVCRDGQNRLWAVGDFLWFSADDGRHWAAVKLPMLMHTSPKRIRANPETPSQMILALEDRGLATIDVQSYPVRREQISPK